jgi:xanthine dehydrogenase YagS FAD-binding subunit
MKRGSNSNEVLSPAVINVVSRGAGEKATNRDVRIAVGGVAHKPWRAWKAESALRGQQAGRENFRAAAEAELVEASGLRGNMFKIELAKRVIEAVLGELVGEVA